MRAALPLIALASLSGCDDTWGEEWQLQGYWLGELQDHERDERMVVDLRFDRRGGNSYAIDSMSGGSSWSSDAGAFRYDGQSVEIEMFTRSSRGWLVPRYLAVGEYGFDDRDEWLVGDLYTTERDGDRDPVGVFIVYRAW